MFRSRSDDRGAGKEVRVGVAGLASHGVGSGGGGFWQSVVDGQGSRMQGGKGRLLGFIVHGRSSQYFQIY